MLNNFAFGTRLTSIEVIREKLTVRNPRFLESRIRVDKATGRGPMAAQEARTGSVPTKRFSGWVEQVTGERTARDRVINLLARSGQKAKQAKPRARLKPGKDFEKFSNYSGTSPNLKSIRMLQTLDRKRWKKPFFLTKKRGVQPGLWVFHRRKLRPLQLFKAGKRVKRVPWHTEGRARYFQRTDLGRMWGRQLRHIYRK